MKLRTAYHCKNAACDEIFEGAKDGRCPICGWADIEALGWLTRSPEEKLAWLRRIRVVRSRSGFGGDFAP